ncbi:hypothetical protein K469DRAFT_273128 [Zopfia rhizophila CBS 207.26]|uniref:Secreted protein n=1 Tax=Zopfia rhizophila CBS 207.26 TaxID=1314779 RepID=A0A6A6DND6_9PEZI|nr:hypothetical protein K469DRAFT_273128 [Zopfia rhizophila CBS 207.26]
MDWGFSFLVFRYSFGLGLLWGLRSGSPIEASTRISKGTLQVSSASGVVPPPVLRLWHRMWLQASRAKILCDSAGIHRSADTPRRGILTPTFTPRRHSITHIITVHSFCGHPTHPAECNMNQIRFHGCRISSRTRLVSNPHFLRDSPHVQTLDILQHINPRAAKLPHYSFPTAHLYALKFQIVLQNPLHPKPE